MLQGIGGESVAEAINNAGQSVGYSQNSKVQDAMLWSKSGQATILQRVGTSTDNEAEAINASGWSVGYSASAKVENAALWSPSGTVTVLQDIGHHQASEAVAINASDWSVGYSDIGYGLIPPTEAVLWSPTGKGTDLNTFLGSGWYNTDAMDLNDAGDITGYGEYHGIENAWLLLQTSAGPGHYEVIRHPEQLAQSSLALAPSK
jgi:hypothetical protein